MGLGNFTESKTTFVTIVDGKWTRRVPAGTDGAVERINKKGDTVHELYSNYVDGLIVGGRIKAGEFGQTVEIDLEDEGEVFNVQIPVPDVGKKGDIFMSFGKCCPNIDPTAVLFMGLGGDKSSGRPFLFMKQHDQIIHPAFTKENPNGMPQWEKKEVMGKVVWNADAQNEFLYKQIKEFFEAVGEAPVSTAKEVLEDAGFQENDAPF